MLSLNAGSAAKSVVGGSEFQTLTTYELLLFFVRAGDVVPCACMLGIEMYRTCPL